MSERMIPLKIADMAVAACNEEIAKLQAENARLKAEVERLDNNCDYLDRKLDEEIDKSAMLCGHIERLRKAGDGMYSWLGVCGRGGNSFGDDWLRAKKGAMLQAEQFDLNMKNRGWNGWNAAKEGKQS